MSRTLEYSHLIVNAKDGSTIEIDNTLEKVAEIICKYGRQGDISITTPFGTSLLNTMGIYVDRCSDAEYMEELRPVLIEKQYEMERELLDCIKNDITIEM